MIITQENENKYLISAGYAIDMLSNRPSTGISDESWEDIQETTRQYLGEISAAVAYTKDEVKFINDFLEK